MLIVSIALLTVISLMAFIYVSYSTRCFKYRLCRKKLQTSKVPGEVDKSGNDLKLKKLRTSRSSRSETGMSKLTQRSNSPS